MLIARLKCSFSPNNGHILSLEPKFLVKRRSCLGKHFRELKFLSLSTLPCFHTNPPPQLPEISGYIHSVYSTSSLFQYTLKLRSYYPVLSYPILIIHHPILYQYPTYTYHILYHTILTYSILYHIYLHSQSNQIPGDSTDGFEGGRRRRSSRGGVDIQGRSHSISPVCPYVGGVC